MPQRSRVVHTLPTKPAPLVSSTRYEIRSELSRQDFEGALQGLADTTGHRRIRHFDSSRSRSLDVTIDGPAVEIRMLSVTDQWVRGNPFRIRVKLVGTLDGAGSVVYSGRVSTRGDTEVTVTNRVLPWAFVIGFVGFVVAAQFSVTVAFLPFAVAFQAGLLYLIWWYAMQAGRPARAVEVARLLLVIGDATQGVVELDPRRLHGVRRLLEPTVLDVPGPLISKAMQTLQGGKPHDHHLSARRRSRTPHASKSDS